MTGVKFGNMSSGFWSGFAIAIPVIPVSIMLRSAGKRRAGKA